MKKKKKSSKSEFEIGLHSNKEECNILAGQNLLEFDAGLSNRNWGQEAAQKT